MAENKLKKTRVISRKNLPAKAPVFETIVICILMRDIPWHGWGAVLNGILLASILMWWLTALVAWAIEEQINVFDRLDILLRMETTANLEKTLSDTIKKYGGKYGQRK